MSNIKLEAEAGAIPNVARKQASLEAIATGIVTYEDITKANELIKPTTISRKDKKTGKIINKEYAEVNQRVKAFRSAYPMGVIETEILSNDNGAVLMRAIVKDGAGTVIATGLAREKEKDGFINESSYIENCETSAVGRALGFAGFGIDTSICSAEEMENAINNQDAIKDIKDNERYDKILFNYCKENNINVNEVAKEYKLNGKSTNEDYKKAYEQIKKDTDKKED